MKRLRLFLPSAAWLLLLSVFLWSSVPAFSAEKKPDQKLSLIARLTTELLLRQHYSEKKIDAALANNVLNEYLRMMDPSRIFFLSEDVESFRKREPVLLASLRSGDLSFAFEVHSLFLRRLTEYRDFSREFLSAPIRYDRDETFDFDRTEAEWPKNADEQRVLWAKRLKNEVIISTLSDRVLRDEAKKDDSSVDPGELYFADHLKPAERILRRVERSLKTYQKMEPIEVTEIYLVAVASAFDPHSGYMSPRTGEDYDIHLSLSLTGIGAVLTSKEGYTTVVEIVANGPADKEGTLKANDRIIAIRQEGGEDVDIIDMPLSKVVSQIRGKEGTRVTLTILSADKGGLAVPKQVVITRGKVPMKDSEAHGEIREAKLPNGTPVRIGILELPSFYSDFAAMRNGVADYKSATRDVQRLITDFKRRNIDGLIIDLRSNGGGSLQEAVLLSGLFIPEGPVVQVRGKTEIDILSDDDGGRVVYDGPMIVLVNRFSASASEIFAAAMRDYNRAIVVGDEFTHGKGTVQILTDLTRYTPFLASVAFPAGELKLTSAKFYRVNGESTQLKGVKSDIAFPGFANIKDTGESSLRFALPWDAIEPARFEAFRGAAAVSPQLIAELKKRSDLRTAKSPEFEKIRKDIADFERITARKSISLDLETRWEEYQKEKKLTEEQSALAKLERAGAASEKNAEEKRRDSYLDETVNIMADMIALEKPARQTASAPTALPTP